MCMISESMGNPTEKNKCKFKRTFACVRPIALKTIRLLNGMETCKKISYWHSIKKKGANDVIRFTFYLCVPLQGETEGQH